MKTWRVISTTIMISALLAGLACDYEERDIFQNAPSYKTTERPNPLFIKRAIYFVSDEQSFRYKLSEYSCFGGMAFIIAVEYLIRRRKAAASTKN